MGPVSRTAGDDVALSPARPSSGRGQTTNCTSMPDRPAFSAAADLQTEPLARVGRV